MLNSKIIEPQFIVSGRGPKIYKHEGNVKFRKLIEQCVPLYRSCSKTEKSTTIDKMVKKINSEGMKFMEYNKKEEEWRELTNDESRRKVGHGFRDFVLIERRQEQQMNKSSNKVEENDDASLQLNNNKPSECIHDNSNKNNNNNKNNSTVDNEEPVPENATSLQYELLLRQQDDYKKIYEQVGKNALQSVKKEQNDVVVNGSKTITKKSDISNPDETISLAQLLMEGNFLSNNGAGDSEDYNPIDDGDFSLSEQITPPPQFSAVGPMETLLSLPTTKTTTSNSKKSEDSTEALLYHQIVDQVKRNALLEGNQEFTAEKYRPDIVKRVTSNQNENVETKRDLHSNQSVKRAAFNRDQSKTSNRLKEKYSPMAVSPSSSSRNKRPSPVKPITVIDGMRSLSISKADEWITTPPAINFATKNNDTTGKTIASVQETSINEEKRDSRFTLDPLLARDWSSGLMQEQKGEEDFFGGLFNSIDTMEKFSIYNNNSSNNQSSEKQAIFDHYQSTTSNGLKEKYAPMTASTNSKSATTPLAKPTSVIEGLRSLSISKAGKWITIPNKNTDSSTVNNITLV
eukprot:CAMPEP_0194146226 /NCGR_PEP_ID=MMETSP0152-20130528/20465_1 /TAXON_ID=1049557 /ORGANISM="Thalassiothrix antarctica, Strain L6-D1" /LENGTH=571 /DNA_ID=CAMNT_0038846705 /DNA_START=31 /DNA_END=1746 /DNA_ORIENTATION=+